MSGTPASGRQDARTRVQSNENTVVSMDAYPRRQVKDEDYKDIKQPIGQIHFARQIIHEWINVLPDDQFKFVFFIFGKTTSWGREEARFTYRLLTNGDREGKYASRGLGKTTRALRTTLGKLEKAGVLRVNRDEEHTKGMLISINFDWTPAENVVPVDTKVKPGANSVSHAATPPEVNFHSPRKLASAPSGSALPDIKAGLLKQDFSKHDSSSRCAAARLAEGDCDFDKDIAYGAEESAPSAGPQDLSAMAIAPPCSSIPADSDQKAASHVSASVEEKRLVLTPGAIEVTFRAAFLESDYANLPGAICPKWSKADYGKVKRSFLSTWTGTPDGAHALVAWSVKNWGAALYSELGWMTKTKPPEFPMIDFFLQWRMFFAKAFGRDHTKTWIRSIKDHEKKEFKRLTLKHGLTPEEARMSISENRVALRLRDEITEKEGVAVQMWRTGKLMEKNAERILKDAERAGRGIPHPNSPAAVEAKRLADLEAIHAARKEFNIQLLGPDEVPDFSNVKPWGEQ